VNMFASTIHSPKIASKKQITTDTIRHLNCKKFTALAHSRQVEELQRKHAQELERSETAAQELDRKFKQALRDGTLLERQIHEMTKGVSLKIH